MRMKKTNKNNDGKTNFAPWLLVIAIVTFGLGIIMTIFIPEDENLKRGFISGANIMAVSATTIIILFISSLIDLLVKKQAEKKKDIHMLLKVVGRFVTFVSVVTWLFGTLLFKEVFSNELINILLGLVLSIGWTIICKSVNDASAEIHDFISKN